MKLLLLIPLALSIIMCGEAPPMARLIATSHGCNFVGTYNIDGNKTKHFSGIEVEYTLKHTIGYDYSVDFDKFTSILINATKLKCDCSLNVSLWVHGIAVATTVSPEYDEYNESLKTCKLTIDPIYYVWESSTNNTEQTNPQDSGTEDTNIYD